MADLDGFGCGAQRCLHAVHIPFWRNGHLYCLVGTRIADLFDVRCDTWTETQHAGQRMYPAFLCHFKRQHGHCQR